MASATAAVNAAESLFSTSFFTLPLPVGAVKLRVEWIWKVSAGSVFRSATLRLGEGPQAGLITPVAVARCLSCLALVTVFVFATSDGASVRDDRIRVVVVGLLSALDADGVVSTGTHVGSWSDSEGD